MTTKITEIDALLKALTENPDSLLGDEVTDRVALRRLTPVVRWLHKSGMRPSEIADWLKSKLHIETTTAQVTKLLPRRPKPKSGTVKKDEGPDAQAAEKKAAAAPTADTPATDTGTGEKSDGKAAEAKPKSEKPEPITLKDVQEWREKDGVVILKTTTVLKPKTRIYTESGKVAEVTICKPTQYGGRFDKHDGMEVSFVLEKE